MDHSETALITGSSRGIGKAAATLLAQHGFGVVIVGRDPTRVDATVAQLVEAGHDVTGFACDVSEAASVARLGSLVAAAGPIDVLVNAAGVMSERMSKTLRTTPEEWRRVLDINLLGAVHMIGQFGPAMADRRRGRVINVSACMGRFTEPGLSGGLAPYRVSKTALNALTRNLASETGFGRRGILVDAMCPGHCRTDMGGPAAPRSAEEGADTIAWLASRSPEGAQTGLMWEDRQPIPW
jgi:3-oxoacyl-[acyl-carrier protein] reductase